MPRFVMTSGEVLTEEITELVIAGWTGRDQAATDEHIKELQELGVSPPSKTPLFYRLSADRLTTDASVQVLGAATSGEVEILLVGTQAGTCVGVGSDHTDREAEAWSVVHSKQLCPKPMAPTLWPLQDVLDHWDSLRLEASVVHDQERVSYQHGEVSNLLPPDVLMEKYGAGELALQPGQVMFCGTLPAIGGIRPAERFEMALVDPVLERRIDHAYDINILPVVS